MGPASQTGECHGSGRGELGKGEGGVRVGWGSEGGWGVLGVEKGVKARGGLSVLQEFLGIRVSL